jgi:cob(I)alamin adenosyltransferase
VGTVDESTAALGLARAQCRAPHSAEILLEAHRDLYKLMAEVAATPENAEKFHFIDAARVIIRRAERRVVELFDAEEIKNPDLQRYLNRLSSMCFVLELLENQAAGNKTTLAKE